MDNTILKKIISYTILTSLYVTGVSLYNTSFDFYWYYIPHGLFLIYAVWRYHKISISIALTLIVIFIYSLITTCYNTSLVFKQVVNISFSALTFYYFIVFENYNLEEIFKKYIKLSKIVLIIGLLQVGLFLLNLDHVYTFIFPYLETSNLSIRFQSITQEPSYIVYLFSPIIFLSLYNLLHKKKIYLNKGWCLLFLLGYVLTFSSIALLSIMICLTILFLIHLTKSTLWLGGALATLLLAVCFIAYSFIEEIKLRVDDTVYALTHSIKDKETYRNVNLSTYALLSNLYVTKETLKEHPITGTGLGTHQLNHAKYLPDEMKEYSSINNQDANSMLLRLLSETGLLGGLVALTFLIRNSVKFKRDADSESRLMWILNTGILIMLLLVLVRNGHYTVHGRLLFIFLLYFTHKKSIAS